MPPPALALQIEAASDVDLLPGMLPLDKQHAIGLAHSQAARRRCAGSDRVAVRRRLDGRRHKFGRAGADRVPGSQHFLFIVQFSKVARQRTQMRASLTRVLRPCTCSGCCQAAAAHLRQAASLPLASRRAEWCSMAGALCRRLLFPCRAPHRAGTPTRCSCRLVLTSREMPA